MVEQNQHCVSNNCNIRIKIILPFYQWKQNTMTENIASLSNLYNEYFSSTEYNFTCIIPLAQKFTAEKTV